MTGARLAAGLLVRALVVVVGTIRNIGVLGIVHGEPPTPSTGNVSGDANDWRGDSIRLTPDPSPCLFHSLSVPARSVARP